MISSQKIRSTKKRQKILIIDDDESLLDIYKTTLDRAGFQTLTATKGKKGIFLAKTSHPDLILLDIMMPEIDGLVILKSLKQGIKTAHIPVVLLTNLPEEAGLKQGIKLKAIDYLLKVQYKPEELAAKVKGFYLKIKIAE